MLTCYSKALFASTVGLVANSEFNFNPHIQAVVMWMLALVAVYGLVRDRNAHGRLLPLCLGLLGLIVVVGTLYIWYSPVIEVSGYLILVAAALLNQNARLDRLNHAGTVDVT